MAAPVNRSHAPGKRDDARSVAFRVLMTVGQSENVRSPEVLSHALPSLTDLRDRALATELVYGVLRWQRALDAAITPHTKRGMEGLEPAARTWLRLGAYQVHFLDRIPREIAVSATQDAARSSGFERLTGLLNAILRKVAQGPIERDALKTLPAWIGTALHEVFGDDAAHEAAALRERATTTVRPTETKGGREAVRAALTGAGLEVNDAAYGYLAVAGGDPFQTRAWRDGLFVAQDPAGAIVIEGVQPGARVLDLCAGRGIKTTALADRGAKVVAIDIASAKLDELMGLARRLGVLDNIEATIAQDGTAPIADLGLFDEVIVDAPCSGLGTLRRHPEIAWRRTPDDVRELAALQARLVQNAMTAVRPGGRLTYAVCSFVRVEGDAALSSAGFELVDRIDTKPSAGLDAFQVRRLRRLA